MVSLGLHGVVVGVLLLRREPAETGRLPPSLSLEVVPAAVPAHPAPAATVAEAAPPPRPVRVHRAVRRVVTSRNHVPSPVREAAPADAPGDASAEAAPEPAGEPPGPSPDWLAALLGWLAAHRHYPAIARRNGIEGAVVVRFIVDRTGLVHAASVIGGSGSAVLDEAALAMLRGARVPAFPASMPEAEQAISVPIRYRLER